MCLLSAPPRVRRITWDGTIPFMWETLSEPWRVCVELAWEAYRAGSLPIGAVVADTEGQLLSSGRNRIHEFTGAPGTVFGRKLAHAELNALLSLEGELDPRSCVLYTTTEPCPLCVGAVRMADVRELRYAAREPWAGSAAMFETVPYLRRANLALVGPENPRLEAILTALLVERYLRLKPKVLSSFLQPYEQLMPQATRAARNAHSSGLLRTLAANGAPASEMVLALSKELPNT